MMSLGMFEEQAGSFSLPHPPLSLRSCLVLESAVVAAWELMVSKPRAGFDLSTADEDKVTHELFERLYDEIFNKGVVDGFDTEIFASVRREPKVRNFGGNHLDKMPDLLVEFVDRPTGVMNSQYGLFVECKPIGATHTVGVHYCDKGVIRFVRGDYAWAMQNAMMIGYARDGYTILPKLADALSDRMKDIPTIKGAQPCKRSKATLVCEVVYITTHRRTFNYLETGKPAPPIELRHLWLKRGE